MDKRIEKITDAIRDVPDFPKKGIIFKDIAPLLNDAKLFSETIELLAETVKRDSIDRIAAIEARGFIFGGALAARLNCGFIPIRKPGKLPFKTYMQEYALEYGTDMLEIHQDAVKNNERILLFDDLLATGGTALAATALIEKCGGVVSKVQFLIELSFLKGSKKLKNYPVDSLISF